MNIFITTLLLCVTGQAITMDVGGFFKPDCNWTIASSGCDIIFHEPPTRNQAQCQEIAWEHNPAFTDPKVLRERDRCVSDFWWGWPAECEDGYCQGPCNKFYVACVDMENNTKLMTQFNKMLDENDKLGVIELLTNYYRLTVAIPPTYEALLTTYSKEEDWDFYCHWMAEKQYPTMKKERDEYTKPVRELFNGVQQGDFGEVCDRLSVARVGVCRKSLAAIYLARVFYYNLNKDPIKKVTLAQEARNNRTKSLELLKEEFIHGRLGQFPNSSLSSAQSMALEIVNEALPDWFGFLLKEYYDRKQILDIYAIREEEAERFWAQRRAESCKEHPCSIECKSSTNSNEEQK